MSETFNSDKLPDYFRDFVGKKVAIVGTGAVGSYLTESSIKMEIGQLYLFDMDSFAADNTAKHSCLLRYPEDVGKNKARALADRAKAIMVEEGNVVGIDANITFFGPMAFSEMDVVVLALDNYAAKIYYNQIWLQIPEKKRPILIFGGTLLENAQSNCLDGKEACLRCLLDESWLGESEKRTSCSGPQFRVVDGVQEVVKTTGQASRISADLMAEQIRGFFLGIDNVRNRRILYSPYPNLSFSIVHPMRRADCPDCRQYHPPKEILYFDGNVCDTTVGELFSKVSEQLGSDEFEVNIPVVEFAKVGYGGLITSGVCHSCGKSMKHIYKHEFRTYYKDIVCDECKKAGKEVKFDAEYPKGEVIRAISPRTVSQELLQKKLFEVGWNVGSYISVTEKPADAMDVFDERVKHYTFTCKGDIELLEYLRELR